VILVAALFIAAGIFDPRLTTLVEGDAFRQEMEKETCKGLHFASGAYAPIKRTGLFSAESRSFKGADGVKAFRTISTEDVTARFNPWGIFLRRWQFDIIHIRSGEARIQIYEPKPEKKPPKPWYTIFLPERVYLKQVICDTANITWEMKNKRAGFFGTQMLITPYGRDFEYHAEKGVFKAPPAPDLPLQKLHMIITKGWLSLYQLDLSPKGGGFIHAEGTAGLKADRSVQAKLTFHDVPLRPWVPPSWSDFVQGTAKGNLTWRGKDEKIESSDGEGQIQLDDAKMRGIPFLDYVATATRNGTLKTLNLDHCSLGFRWQYPKLEIRDIDLAMKDEFRLKGAIILNGEALSGTLDFGVAAKNLEELPKAKETIFTRSESGLLWTTVHLSGSLKEPQNDLIPRLSETLRQSPGQATGLFFREIGEWLEQTFKGKGD